MLLSKIINAFKGDPDDKPYTEENPNPFADEMVKDYMYMGDGMVEEVLVPKGTRGLYETNSRAKASSTSYQGSTRSTAAPAQTSSYVGYDSPSSYDSGSSCDSGSSGCD